MNNTESKIRYTLDELKIGMKVKQRGKTRYNGLQNNK